MLDAFWNLVFYPLYHLSFDGPFMGLLLLLLCFFYLVHLLMMIVGGMLR